MKCIICKNEIIGVGNNPAPIAGNAVVMNVILI